MNILEQEIEEIIFKQEKQLVQDLGETLELQPTYILGQESTKYARTIAQELKINFGSALCLVFWLEELLKIYSKDIRIIKISADKQERIIQLGRLIKISGGQKGLNFCRCQLPEYAQEDFRATWDEKDNWKKTHKNPRQ